MLKASLVFMPSLAKTFSAFFNRSAGTRALKRTEFDMAQKCSFMLAKSNGFNLHYPSRSGLKTMLNVGFWILNGGPPSRFAAQVKTPWRVEDDVEFWILDFEWWIGG